MVNLVQNSNQSSTSNQVYQLNLIDKIVSRIQELDDYGKSTNSSSSSFSNGFFHKHPVHKQTCWHDFKNVNKKNSNCAKSAKTRPTLTNNTSHDLADHNGNK